MSDTINRLGASSVSMSSRRDITVVYHDEKYTVMANSNMVMKIYTRSVSMKYPVVLYLNKAMAPGDFFRLITGREAIEKEGIMILLPEGVNLDKDLKEQLFKTAGKLF